MAEGSQLDSSLGKDSSVELESSVSENEEAHTVGDSASSLVVKEHERKRIESDVEAFLAAGGKIQSIENNVVSEPPKKPESAYGSKPI